MIEKILQLLVSLLERWQNREAAKLFGSVRSKEWPRVRKEWLKDHPLCAVCGGNKKIQVHHLHPVHAFPELELDSRNFLTLCESGKIGAQCHRFVGHLGNFMFYNPTAPEDSKIWNKKIKERVPNSAPEQSPE